MHHAMVYIFTLYSRFVKKCYQLQGTKLDFLSNLFAESLFSTEIRSSQIRERHNIFKLSIQCIPRRI